MVQLETRINTKMHVAQIANKSLCALVAVCPECKVYNHGSWPHGPDNEVPLAPKHLVGVALAHTYDEMDTQLLVAP